MLWPYVLLPLRVRQWLLQYDLWGRDRSCCWWHQHSQLVLQGSRAILKIGDTSYARARHPPVHHWILLHLYTHYCPSEVDPADWVILGNSCRDSSFLSLTDGRLNPLSDQYFVRMDSISTILSNKLIVHSRIQYLLLIFLAWYPALVTKACEL